MTFPCYGVRAACTPVLLVKPILNNRFDIVLIIVTLIENILEENSIMFEVTEKALEMISERMKDMDDGTVIRLYLNQGG